jgi:23S rRNA-intervening sequence protein
MSESNQSFTELDVWRKARVLKNELKEIADKFPAEEKYRLTDQLVRSSRSISVILRKVTASSLIKIRFTFAFKLVVL